MKDVDSTVPVVCVGDREQPQRDETMPLTIVLDRLRSAFNVGNIFRLAEAVRAEQIVACGYTAAPPHPKLAKTARGCDELVSCRQVETCEIALRELKEQGYHIYGVETVEGATAYWDCRIEFPAAFVLGNEALGISAEALALCDGFIMLPACGLKNSINVGNCAGVVLFEALRQWQLDEVSS